MMLMLLMMLMTGGPVRADGPHPTYLGRTLYTGEFHAHTSVSDGAKLPADAFAHVWQHSGVDFFALSEHDVMWDIRNGDDFITDWHDASSAEWKWLHEQAAAFTAAHPRLVVVPATENTWYDGTGHINTFNTAWHATARATEQGSVDGFHNRFGTGDLKYDMFTFFARLKQDSGAIGQFNHPTPRSKGSFFDFKGLDPVTDARMQLIEVHNDAQARQFQRALDAGWHLGPVSNGDDHSANWVTSNEALTGIWATGHSLQGLYAAMRARSVYSTRDSNVVLEFSANGAIMGSILPAGTRTLAFDIGLSDADSTDSFTSVQLITNDGVVAHDFAGVSGNSVHLSLTRDVRDGDFYYVSARQADGQFVVSAPIWVGPTTRGANYAPTITIATRVPAHAALGQRIALPEVSATDDSGDRPTLSFEVWDGAGAVPVVDGHFAVRSYDDHFIVVKATDATGNTNAELIRIQVDRGVLDPAAVFQYLGSTVTVAELPNDAGIAVSTDRSIARVYLQARRKGTRSWTAVPVLASTNDRPWEINTIGTADPDYQHSITGQTLRSHEFALTGLAPGATYEYRLGVPVRGGAPAPSDASAWTAVRGAFTVPGRGNEPVYMISDPRVGSHDSSNVERMRGVVARLRRQAPGGSTLIEAGDLVDNGAHGQYWGEVFDHALNGFDLELAPVVGDRDALDDRDYDSVTHEHSAIFANLFALPKNGALPESNYSFDRGDVHIAVLNTNVALDEQLAWLASDLATSPARWKVVVGHASWYGSPDSLEARPVFRRQSVAAALDSLGVRLYIGGHDGLYKRSTIDRGQLATTSHGEALRRGTTFVTLSSAGGEFGKNRPYWWDDVVFDEGAPMGAVLEARGDGLSVRTWTLDGRLVDSFTLAPSAPPRVRR